MNATNQSNYRFKNYGRKVPVALRFWKHVDKRGPNDCWLWTAGKNKAGYGVVMDLYRPSVASRVAWRLTYGPIPKGKYVCHKCDNPPCVNPNHLFVGTSKDNTLDSVAKGRMARVLSWEKVNLIRQMYQGRRGEQTTLARRFGVTLTTINGILHKRIWKNA